MKMDDAIDIAACISAWAIFLGSVYGFTWAVCKMAGLL
jgi:hypothetical protein